MSEKKGHLFGGMNESAATKSSRDKKDGIVNSETTKELMRKFNIRPNKAMGQNFLINPKVLRAIIDAADLTPEDTVIEIGPGMGTMTEELLKRAGKVIAIELDKQLAPLLAKTLEQYSDKLQIICADVLKTDIAALVKDAPGPVKLVANLPYYITTPIITTLIEKRIPIERMVFMVQKEVAERMAAPPGGKEYGALSVLVQYYTVPTLVCDVLPESFIPQPEVVSEVIVLERRTRPAVMPRDEKLFFNVVKAAFGQRRKTLLNALTNAPYFDISKEEIRDMLVYTGIDENARGETLSLMQFCNLTDVIYIRKFK